MNNRSGNVECARFIAATLIMAHHIYNIGVDTYPFHEAWIYVEFFLLMTGYYTAKHYSGKCFQNRSREAFQYTIKKIIPLFPYAFIASVFGWCTQGVLGIMYQGWTLKDLMINFMGDFIFDILLISDSFGHPLIAPLWYVSALMIVFPLFALFAQLKNRYTKMIISIICSLMYYGWVGVSCNRTFPHDMLRVFVGMMLGLVIYEFSIVFKEHIASKPKLFLTIIEVLAFTYPIYCSFRNFSEKGHTTTRLYLLCYFVTLLLLLPGFTFSANITGKFFNYLGKLSIPVFILHWYIGTLVYVFGEVYQWNSNMRITVYFIATLIVSILVMYFVDKCKWWQRILKKEIVLTET